MILGTTLITLPQVMEGRAAGGQGIDQPRAAVAAAETSALLPYRLQARVETPFSATSPTGALGIAASADGRVALVNVANRVQVFDADARLMTAWGATGPGDGQFDAPRDIAFAPDGTVYVADTGNHRIQQFTADGRLLRMLGGPGSAPGQFDEPWAIDVAPDGTIAVADRGNRRVQLFWPDGRVRTVWGQQGLEPDPYVLLRDVAFLSTDELCVADGNTLGQPRVQRIQCFDLDGQLLRTWGEPGSGPGQLQGLSAIVAGRDGTVYVVDGWYETNGRIQRFDRFGTLLGTIGRASAPAQTYAWFPIAATVLPDGGVLILHDWGPITHVGASLDGARVWGPRQLERPTVLASSFAGTTDIAADARRGILLATREGVYGFDAAGVPLGDRCFGCGWFVAFGPSGQVFAEDTPVSQPALVNRTGPDGQQLPPWTWPPDDAGWPIEAYDLTTSPDGTLYGAGFVADEHASNVAIVRFQPDGAAHVVARLAANGGTPRIAVDGDANAYVAERGSPVVRVLSLGTGEVRHSWGAQGDSASNFGPGGISDVAVDHIGHVFTVDVSTGRILAWTRKGGFLGVIGPSTGGVALTSAQVALSTLTALPDGTLVGPMDSGAVILEPATTRRWRREIYAEPWWSGGLITATTFVGEIDIADWTAILPREVPRDRFSARFTADVRLGPGEHAVTVEAAGPTRLWIDDRLVIERTGDGPAVQRATASPGAGVHRVQLDVARPGDTTRLVIVPDNRPAYLPAAWR